MSISQLEVLLKGVFDKKRFLDLVRDFIIFEEDASGRVVKKMAGYHQFHAVQVAVQETPRQLDRLLRLQSLARVGADSGRQAR